MHTRLHILEQVCGRKLSPDGGSRVNFVAGEDMLEGEAKVLQRLERCFHPGTIHPNAKIVFGLDVGGCCGDMLLRLGCILLRNGRCWQCVMVESELWWKVVLKDAVRSC